MEALPGLIMLLLGLGVVVVFFVIGRYFTLWYFRLDSIADNLEKIAKHTEYLAMQTPPAGLPAAPARAYPPPTVHLTPAP